MLQPFQPVVLAALEVPGKTTLLAYATPDVRQEYIRGAQDALTELEDTIERLLTVDGLPPGTACYPGGQKGWEFDVNRQLKKVAEAARELIQAAMKSPPHPTRRVPITEPWTATEIEAYDRQLKECNQTSSECTRLARRLRKAHEKLLNLQCSVAQPGHIVPVSTPPAQNAERQVEVSVPPPPPSPPKVPLGQPADATSEPRKPTAILMASRDLADALGVPERANAVDTALRKFAKKNPGCRDTVENPRKWEPRFLYRVDHVWMLLLAKLPRWRGSSLTTD